MGWSHTYSRAISVTGNTAILYRAEGKAYTFKDISGNGSWSTDADVKGFLYETYDANYVMKTGWSYTTAEGEKENYNLSGQLIKITDSKGYEQSLVYSDTNTPVTIAPVPGLLIHVYSYGSVNFTYDASNRIRTITDQAGRVWTYSTDSNSNLISVTHPDNTVLQYLYGESVNTGGTSLPHALTGIIDENGSRYMTYKYNADGKAVEELSPSAGSNVNHNLLAYNTDASGNPVSTVVTDGLGTSRTYNFVTVLGVARFAGQSQPSGSGCSASSSSLSYDANGNVASRTDFMGKKTCYAYDLATNKETVRVEGLAAGVACPANLSTYTPSTATGSTERKISTNWDWYRNKPLTVSEPLRITTYSYLFYPVPLFEHGVLQTLTIQPTTDTTGGAGFGGSPAGTARTITYNNNNYYVPLIQSVDGARTDVADITTYGYDYSSNLSSVTNALNQTTTLSGYDALGHVGSITDPNGLVTSLSYDARGRLTSRSVGGETTNYTYDGVGQLKTINFPSGAVYTYSYDAAHRLTDIADNQYNYIHYTLDVMGNHIKEEIFDNAGHLVKTHSRVFDALGRLYKDIGAINQTTTYAYDADGNLTSIADPLNHQTINAYDALNRLSQSTDAANGITRYGYDGQDQLILVTDPRNLATRYTRDGLGNLKQQTSPDTGTTVYTYDAAGNVLTRSDTKGQVASYTYDALNRISTISYSGGTTPPQSIAYQYDQGTNGIGHLTGIIDATGITNYSYDQHGRLITETEQAYGATYTTAYDYDAQGRLATLTYPSGRTVSYTFDSQGRINSIATSFNGNAQSLLASNITYEPFGAVHSFTYGDGSSAPVQTYTRQIDQDGRIASYTLNGKLMSIGYDAASQISFISDSQNPANLANYSYDPMSRLTSYTQGTANQNFGYDLDGNRISQVIGSTTTGFGYGTNSNWLTSIQTGAGTPQPVNHDANGATTADPTRQYAYDNRGRLIQAITAQGIVNYEINALGLRVRKQVPYANTDTLYHYDAQGHLIAENENGNPRYTREYVYLGDQPIAVLQ